ncbi:MAG: glucokinase [Verrucomicrobia bacterium]|nr:glucokinase [Verrucomicrobiota bacterium]
MRYLCCDVGGTKTVFALYQEEGKKLTLVRKERFLNSDFENLFQMGHLFLGKEEVDVACLAVAAPISKRSVTLTNLAWVIDADLFKETFGFKSVFLINDLKASAYGLSVLGPRDYCLLQRGKTVLYENKVLISPGTGLGEALLFFDGKEYLPSATEGGHTDFPATNEREFRLFQFLQKKFSHVSIERILSGPGFMLLYQFLVEVEGFSPKKEVEETMKKEDPSKVITKFGIEGSCFLCQEVLSLFTSILGKEAGNLALKAMALSGVFLGGGIPPKILSALKKDNFLSGFLAKGRFSDLLKDVPVAVVLEENTVINGAALYAQKSLHS